MIPHSSPLFQFGCGLYAPIAQSLASRSAAPAWAGGVARRRLGACRILVRSSTRFRK